MELTIIIPTKNRLFYLNRTLKYCTKDGGWTLNAGSAQLFGLTNN